MVRIVVRMRMMISVEGILIKSWVIFWRFMCDLGPKGRMIVREVGWKFERMMIIDKCYLLFRRWRNCPNFTINNQVVVVTVVTINFFLIYFEWRKWIFSYFWWNYYLKTLIFRSVFCSKDCFSFIMPHLFRGWWWW